VEVKFVAYVFERNTSFCYANHYICKCVLHMHETITVGNGRQFPTLLRRRMHGAAQRRRENFRISKEFSAVCS
jgi:hypothetical protein